MFFANRSRKQFHKATMDASQTPPQDLTFTCFPDLPLEIRQKTWKHASFFDRDVVVRFQKVTSTSSRKISTYMSTRSSTTFYAHQSPTLPPALLHASHEAREEGLRYYQLTFGIQNEYKDGGMKVNLTCEPRIYANFVSDRVWPICSSWKHWHAIWSQLMVYGIRSIAIDDEMPWELLSCQGTQQLEDIYVYHTKYKVENEQGNIAIEVANDTNMGLKEKTELETFDRMCMRASNRWWVNKQHALQVLRRIAGELAKYEHNKSLRLNFETIFSQRTEWKTPKITMVMPQLSPTSSIYSNPQTP